MGFGPLGVKEAVEMSKNTKITGNEKTGTSEDTTKTESKTVRPTRTPRTAGDVKGVKKIMGYPLARGPRDETGDALVIKCIEYQPPEVGFGLELATEFVFAKDRDGNTFVTSAGFA